MENLLEVAIKELTNSIDALPSYQQDNIRRLVKEAMELSYKQGREDQRYHNAGPKTIKLYE